MHNQAIVIQGPTQFYKEICECYRNIDNVVWSTWYDEPSENLNYIGKQMSYVLSRQPEFPGYLNINMQNVSAIKGINYITENPNITEILKTRSDIWVSDAPKLLEILKGKQAAFIGTCKENVRKDLYYFLGYHHFSHDYPDNNFLYGTKQNVYNAFNFTTNAWDIIPPESLIAYSLMEGMNIEFNLNFEYMKSKGIYFFFKDVQEAKIDIKWLKHNSSINETYLHVDEYDW